MNQDMGDYEGDAFPEEDGDDETPIYSSPYTDDSPEAHYFCMLLDHMQVVCDYTIELKHMRYIMQAADNELPEGQFDMRLESDLLSAAALRQINHIVAGVFGNRPVVGFSQAPAILESTMKWAAAYMDDTAELCEEAELVIGRLLAREPKK